MMKRIAIAAVFGMAAMSVSADSFKATNRLIVNPVPDGGFEVIEGRGEGAAGIWCAAGSYALRRLGANGDTKVYVKEPRGPSKMMPGRIGVVFTLDPTGITPNDTLVFYQTIRDVGYSLSVAQARSHCHSQRFHRTF